MTARFLSDRTGEVTISVGSQSKQLHTWRVSDYTPDFRETNSVGRRKLMTQDEVLRMPLDEALIILRGQKVFKVKKFDYTLHPESKKLKKRKAVMHIPLWQKKEEKLREEKQKHKEMLDRAAFKEEQLRVEPISQMEESSAKNKMRPITKKELMSKK